MDFRLLGSLEVVGPEGDVAVQRGKPTALLQLLLLRAPEPVPIDRLVTALWGEEPPASAEHAVEVYISRLRRSLGAERLERVHGGYRMRLAPEDTLDLRTLDALLHAAERARTEGRTEAAVGHLQEAEDLWRGPALSELTGTTEGRAEVDRLEEIRLGATQTRIDLRLAAGGHADLLPELERLLAAHPFRERFHAQMMLALYRSGRQADALTTYQRARASLDAELGVEPGPALQALQIAILNQEPSLDGPQSPGPTADRQPDGGVPAARPAVGRRGAPVRALLVLLLVLAGAGLVIVVRPGPTGLGAATATPPGSTPSGPSTSETGLSPDESELHAIVPAGIRSACEPTPSGGGRTPNALASLRCVLPFGSMADTVWYEAFDTPQALAIEAERAVPADLADGTCSATTTGVIGRWSSGETFNGVLACHLDDGAAWIVWTYEGGREDGPQQILARAVQEGTDDETVATLWGWWYETAILLR